MGKHQPILQLAELFDCVEDVLAWVKDREGRYLLGQPGVPDQL